MTGTGAPVAPERLARRRLWYLVALCAGTNLFETALVMGLDDGARPNLAPQASAVWPFGVFGDMRWISVYHDTWLTFGLEIAAMLLVRGALTGSSVLLAWPERLPRPSVRALVVRGAVSSAVAAALLSPSVALLFGAAAVPLSWLFLSAVPAALLVTLLVHPLAVSRDWWRRPMRPRAIGWILLAFVVFGIATLVMAEVPMGLWPLVAAAAGVFNAYCWRGLVGAVVDRPAASRVVPLVPVGVVALVGVVIGGAVLGFSRAHPHEPPPTAVPPAKVAGATPLLVVSGYGSTWDGRIRHPVPGDYYEQQFSYRGTSRSGEPLPYRSSDTVKGLPVLERMLLAQVERLHGLFGRRVDVVAESEGAVVAKAALVADRSAPVATLVLASPLLSPGKVWFPTVGSQGWGVASRELMGAIGSAFQSVSPVDLSPDSTFLASVDRSAPYLARAMTCPLGHIRQLAVLPLADATVTPDTTGLGFPYVVVPSFHGGLVESSSAARLVSTFLSGRQVTGSSFLRLADHLVRSASSAWQVPPLALSDFPDAGGLRSASALSCSGAASRLAHDLDG
jgi:hypothetical protein